MSRRHWLTAIAFAASLFLPTAGRAELDYFFGTDKGFWDDAALVVARIVESKPDAGNTGTLELEVQAVALTDTLVPTKLSLRR